MATDNNLEQYQSTLYAFFQGSGEIYVGGITWFNEENKWIINWVNIGNKLNADDAKRARKDPCMVVVGTDLFVIGGLNSKSQRITNSWGYRLSQTGTWFEVMDYLMTKRANATCIVDKSSKDIFTIGGNKEGPLTVEIGRYLANKESVYDRLMGYKCKNEANATEENNCYHIQLKNNTFEKGHKIYAFQLDNDDGNAYTTIVIGWGANNSFKAIRLHNDEQRNFSLALVKSFSTLIPLFSSNYTKLVLEALADTGNNNFHVVPIKTIGFHACMKRVPFRTKGKLVIPAPEASNNQLGYWWDKKNKFKKEKRNYSYDEYYYYLNPTDSDDEQTWI